VFVAHPHLELIDEEGREGGDFPALLWQRAMPIGQGASHSDALRFLMEVRRAPLSDAVSGFNSDVILTIAGQDLKGECKCRSNSFSRL